MTEKRITAAAVRELCGGISDMTLWRWLDRLGFPRPTYIAPAALLARRRGCRLARGAGLGGSVIHAPQKVAPRASRTHGWQQGAGCRRSGL